MNAQQKQIAVAKLAGFELPPRDTEGVEILDNHTGPVEMSNQGIKAVYPDYLHSRDAIIPVIEKQSQEVKEQVVINLWAALEIDSDWSELEAWAKNFSTTPEQLVDALLKATGQYTD